MQDMDVALTHQVFGGENNLYDCGKTMEAVGVDITYSSFNDSEAVDKLIASCSGCYFSADKVAAKVQIIEVLGKWKAAAMSRRMQQQGN